MFSRTMHFGGSWYPDGRADCRHDIETFQSKSPPKRSHTARVALVPHAGWIYSGGLAWEAFNNLVDEDGLDLVVVLGGHLDSQDPLVAMCQGEWQTPFGPFSIYPGFAPALETVGAVVLENENRAYPDNSVELQLPFAKYKYPQAQLLPMRLPPNNQALKTAGLLARHLEAEKLSFVVVASTDLTHYGPHYGMEHHGRGLAAHDWVKNQNDQAFIQAAASGDPAQMLHQAQTRHNACSAGAAAAAAQLAAHFGWHFQLLGHTTSAEVSGDSADNFVGYMAAIYH